MPNDHQSTDMLYCCPDSISGAITGAHILLYTSAADLEQLQFYMYMQNDIPIYGVVPQIDCLSSVKLVIFDRPKSLNWTWPNSTTHNINT